MNIMCMSYVILKKGPTNLQIGHIIYTTDICLEIFFYKNNSIYNVKIFNDSRNKIKNQKHQN